MLLCDHLLQRPKRGQPAPQPKWLTMASVELKENNGNQTCTTHETRSQWNNSMYHNHETSWHRKNGWDNEGKNGEWTETNGKLSSKKKWPEREEKMRINPTGGDWVFKGKRRKLKGQAQACSENRYAQVCTICQLVQGKHDRASLVLPSHDSLGRNS